ncbi:hypothetical protein ABPG72_008417 [Tetrahymena utriculariae]
MYSMGGGLSKMRLLKIMLVGLDNAGKTTFIKWLRSNLNGNPGQNLNTVPTVGYNMEKFVKNNFQYQIYDMSGQSKYREMWNNYCKEIVGIIFVIDSTDYLRFQVVANEVELLLEQEDIKNRPVPILFLANKSDMQGAIAIESMKEKLKLSVITDRQWEIFQTNSLKGANIENGFQWLTVSITKAFPEAKYQN